MKLPNKYLQIIATSIVCYCIVSCDIFSTARIANSSNHTVTILIQHDKDAINKKFGNNSYYLGTLPLEYNGEVSFNRKSLTSTIKLKSKDTLTIEHSRGYKPNFALIKRIQVYSRDTLNLNTREEMSTYFIEKNDQDFILDLK